MLEAPIYFTLSYEIIALSPAIIIKNIATFNVIQLAVSILLLCVCTSLLLGSFAFNKTWKKRNFEEATTSEYTKELNTLVLWWSSGLLISGSSTFWAIFMFIVLLMTKMQYLPPNILLTLLGYKTFRSSQGRFIIFSKDSILPKGNVLYTKKLFSNSNIFINKNEEEEDFFDK